MAEHYPVEFIGNNAVLHSDGRVCETPEDLIRSPHFRQVIDGYIDGMSRHHSMLLDIFGEEQEYFVSRIKSFFDGFMPGGENSAVIGEKREISTEERDLLVDTLVLLLKLKAGEVPAVLKPAERLLRDSGLFMQFVDGLYEFWRRLDRFLVISNDRHNLRPRTVIKENVEKLNSLIINIYRDIRESLMKDTPRTYRQIRAGAEMTVITQQHPAFPLGGIYSRFAMVPMVRQAIIAPPLILNPPMNKRTGSFERASKNPAGLFDIQPGEWLCYPAKVGELVIYIYFHKIFIELGCSLCNLFDLAYDSELEKKPDAVYFYGVPGDGLDQVAEFPTVFFEDTDNGLLTAAVPGLDEFGYFGYLKKMILTLPQHHHDEKRAFPLSWCFCQGYSERRKGSQHSPDRRFWRGQVRNPGGLSQGRGRVYSGSGYHCRRHGFHSPSSRRQTQGYGTEIGAFLRVDDLGPGFAFGQMDGAIIMSAARTNARIIIPVTPFANIVKGHDVDFVLYANNYEEIGPDNPVIARFSSCEEALNVFREGKVMSKGTTTSTGIVGTYFANIFGPPQYRELHDEIAERYFQAFFNNGVFVGQMRTQLGVPGCERTGPKESARALLETILKQP